MSLTDELASLRAKGYTTDFSAVAEGLRCGTCGHTHDPRDATIEAMARFEGASDPGDEAILLAIACVACGARGVLVAAYGPTATGPEAAVINRLRDARP